MGPASASSHAPPAENPKKDTRQKAVKTVAQEAWALLKSTTVKVTEADSLRVVLTASGMNLDCITPARAAISLTCTRNWVSIEANFELLRGSEFVGALIKDAEPVISELKAAYNDLREAISKNCDDDDKRSCLTILAEKVKAYDSKMKSIRKAMPAPAGKSKAKAKAKASN